VYICSFSDLVCTNFGLYLASNIEFPTTVIELSAIAAIASIGSQPKTLSPRNRTSAPAAIGIRPVLYANAQNRFCNGYYQGLH
jgi:hypothetical protein